MVKHVFLSLVGYKTNQLNTVCSRRIILIWPFFNVFWFFNLINFRRCYQSFSHMFLLDAPQTNLFTLDKSSGQANSVNSITVSSKIHFTIADNYRLPNTTWKMSKFRWLCIIRQMIGSRIVKMFGHWETFCRMWSRIRKWLKWIWTILTSYGATRHRELSTMKLSDWSKPLSKQLTNVVDA